MTTLHFNMNPKKLSLNKILSNTGLTYTDKTKEGMPELVEHDDPVQLSDFTDRVKILFSSVSSNEPTP